MITDLFKIPLYDTKLDLDLNAIKAFVEKQDTVSFEHDNGGQQTQDLDVQRDTELYPLFSAIEEHGNIFAKNLELDHNEYKIDTIWINVNSYKDFNGNHIHPQIPKGISGSFYVSAPSGDVVFEHPSTQLIQSEWKGVINHNRYNSAVWHIPPEPNQLLMFPNWLPHYVTANMSNDVLRISISFNLKPNRA
tara:strand:+ start:452 stop:1024 length:573 start_codon:yes stop_codon:yes gene_type:complete